MQLGDATWREVEAMQGLNLLVVPIGSVEQHGPHLPLDTDTTIAVALANRLALVRNDLVVAPAVSYGASGEHAAFPGTLLLNHEVLANLLIELVRSARAAFRGVIIVSGHGGNLEALTEVSHRGDAEGDEVLVWSAAVAGGDAHAGRTETSLMLALAPDRVRLHLAEPGCTDDLSTILPKLRVEGVRPVASNGVLGDPTGADAQEGRELLEMMTTDLATAVAQRWSAP
ncbi:MAG TPA: mycofactocin biosynthesis peptidyl-dipeptidase MftE [Acidimicrobiales bacterium]|nr:mycofactocin biosynthesis peptidyl-dipeptidase MftE [Acidimicrobiales bacterium]